MEKFSRTKGQRIERELVKGPYIGVRSASVVIPHVPVVKGWNTLSPYSVRGGVSTVIIGSGDGEMVHDYLTKPFEVQALQSCVRQDLEEMMMKDNRVTDKGWVRI